MAQEEINYIGSTKKQLWDAYNAAKEKLDSMNKVVTTTDAAKKTNNEKILNDVNDIDFEALAGSLSEVANRISDANNMFLQLDKAISLKKQELKDIHDVEASANSAAAFAIAKEEFEKKHKEGLKREAQLFDEALEERKKTEEQRVEEWEYNFRIKKRDMEDKLKRELNERVEEVAVREKAIGDAEKEIKELKSEISMLEYKFDNVVAEEVEKIKKDLERSAAISRQIMENKHQSDMAIKEEMNNSLKYKIGDMGKVIDQQREQIAQMQNQINNMATAALRAQGDAATINRVAEVVASGGNKK